MVTLVVVGELEPERGIEPLTYALSVRAPDIWLDIDGQIWTTMEGFC